MLAALLDENGYVYIITDVPSMDFLPGLIDATGLNIGDHVSADGTVTPPPPAPPVPPPAEITPRQARLALHGIGKLVLVEEALDAIEDEDTRTRARIEWDHASSIRRASPLVAMLAAQIGLTTKETDDLFRVAYAL